MIDVKLRRIQAVAAVIVILVGIFLLVGCSINKMNIAILSITRGYDLALDQQGEKHTSSIPVNPVVDPVVNRKFELSPTLDLMP